MYSISAVGLTTLIASAVFYFGPMIPWAEVLTLE
jgi:hypothetical protein